jgi:hypothetical protein
MRVIASEHFFLMPFSNTFPLARKEPRSQVETNGIRWISESSELHRVHYCILLTHVDWSHAGLQGKECQRIILH